MKQVYMLVIIFIAFVALCYLLAVSYICFSTFMHEKAHVDAAAKQNINLTITRIKCISFTKEHPGLSGPASKEDCEKFNMLTIENKKLITHAGFWKEFLLGIFTIMTLGILGFIYRKVLFNPRNLYLWLWVLILASAVAAILISYICNVYCNPSHYFSSGNICRFCSSPYSDWNTTALNCSIYG